MTTCDACGKGMTYFKPGLGGEITVIGLQIRIDAEDQGLITVLNEAMKPYQVNRAYNVCYPCWLRSLGVKEEQTALEGE